MWMIPVAWMSFAQDRMGSGPLVEAQPKETAARNSWPHAGSVTGGSGALAPLGTGSKVAPFQQNVLKKRVAKTAFERKPCGGDAGLRGHREESGFPVPLLPLPRPANASTPSPPRALTAPQNTRGATSSRCDTTRTPLTWCRGNDLPQLAPSEQPVPATAATTAIQRLPTGPAVTGAEKMRTFRGLKP